jgi:hypothetical protein
MYLPILTAPIFTDRVGFHLDWKVILAQSFDMNFVGILIKIAAACPWFERNTLNGSEETH